MTQNSNIPTRVPHLLMLTLFEIAFLLMRTTELGPLLTTFTPGQLFALNDYSWSHRITLATLYSCFFCSSACCFVVCLIEPVAFVSNRFMWVLHGRRSRIPCHRCVMQR